MDPTARPLPRDVAALLTVALVTFALCLAGGFVWDDRNLIEFNPLLDGAAGLPRLLGGDFWPDSFELGGSVTRRYYRPWVSLSYFTVAQVAGRAPWAFHLVNLALHLACVALCHRWLLRRVAGPHARGAALVGAAVFALHPSRVEPVAWISGCTDLWLTLWCLVAVEAFDRGTRRGTAVAGVAAALAMFSKETAVVLPALLAADAWLRASPERPAREGLRRAAWVALGVGAAALVHQWRVPVVAVASPTGAASRVLSTLGCYVAHVAWPWPQSALFGRVAEGEAPPAWWALVGALTVGAFAVVAGWARRERGWLADALWLALPLAPVLNLTPLGLDVLAADRFLYLPMLGVAALVARTLSGARERAVLLLAGAVTVAWAVTSARGVERWERETTLWAHELSLRPADAWVADHLSTGLLAEERPAESLDVVARTWRRIGRPGAVAETRLSLLRARALLEGAPDADGATLRALRDFYEGAARAPAGVRVAVETRYGAVAYTGGAADPRVVYNTLVVPRAQSLLRAADYGAAEAAATGLLARNPRSVPLWNVLVASLVARDRCPDALRAMDAHDRALAPTPTLRGALRACAATTGVDHAVALGRVMLMARTFTAARAHLALAVTAHPEVDDLRFQRVYAEALDRQWDRADALAAELARDLPASGPRVAGLRAELAAARARDRWPTR